MDRAFNVFSTYVTPFKPIPTALQHTGALKNPIKAILFDVYGTLFISGSGDIGVAQKQAQVSVGLEQLAKKYHIKESVSDLLKRFFQTIEQTHNDLKADGIDFPEVDIRSIWTTVLNLDDINQINQFALEYELINNPIFPMPNLGDIIDDLNDKHMIMGIISNAQFYTPLLFKYFLKGAPEKIGFSHELLFYSYQFGYAKPSLFLFQKAAQQLSSFNLFPNQVLYVGNDTLNDIRPAAIVGFQTALFAGDRRSLRLRKDDPRCHNVFPDIILTDLSQLKQYC